MSDEPIVFRSSDQPRTYFTITADGKFIPGPGLSMEEATQEAAKMLAAQFAYIFEAAILAERERCARIAEPFCPDGPDIASAIRTGAAP